MVFEMGDKRPYNYSFVRCFHLAFSPCILLVSIWCIYTVVLTVTAWKKSCSILLEIRFPYDLLIAVHMLTLRSVDGILLPRYVNLSTNFRGQPFKMVMTSSHSKHMNCFICVHIEVNASCYLFQAMQ